jgi:shikimate kinase
MIIALIGESCTGKTTIADILQEETGARLFTGKDYMKLAKNPEEAKKLFKKLLLDEQESKNHIIYVISEVDQMELLPKGSFRILLEADLGTIKKRFSERLKGAMPPPIETMLERKHGMFAQIEYQMKFKTDESDPNEIYRKVSGELWKI